MKQVTMAHRMQISRPHPKRPHPSMDEGESPTKADEEMVCTDAKEGTKEKDEPMQEGEQGEAKPTEDVNDKPATPSDTSVAVAEEGKSDEAPRTNTPNKEGSTQRKSYGARHLRND